MIFFVVGVAVGAGVVGLVAWWVSRNATLRMERLVAAAELGAPVPAPTDKLERSVVAAYEKLNESSRAKLEAANTELRLREQSLSGIDDGVVLLNAEARVVYANAAAEAILGNALSDGILRHTVLTSLAASASEGGVVESRFDDPIDRRSFRGSARVVDGHGSTVVVVRDETDMRRMAAVRRDFVADASHELKTPVAAIRAASETVLLALADGDLAGAQRFAENVHVSAERLSHLVTDLLDLSRLESAVEGGEVVELGSVVYAEVSRLAGAEPAPTLQAVDEPIEIIGSASEVTLAVGNLLANAIRYTPPDGAVTVRVIPEDGWVTLEVADTGAGIPSKDLPRVFERFYRVDPARSRATGGTGLGLSIVRHVVELHGGTVSVASVLGEGSTFRIRLPLAPVVV